MIAIREVQDVTSGSITIVLPTDFQAKRVEILVRALEEPTPEAQSLPALLLTGPTLTEAELEQFTSVREWMNEWRA